MKIEIHHYHHHSNRLLEAFMSVLDDKLAELKDAVSKEIQQLADAVAAQAPDLSPQVAKIQEMIDALKADDPAAPAP